jgi:hypothetical protein
MADYRLALSRDRKFGDARHALDRLVTAERQEKREAARREKLAREQAKQAAREPSHQVAAVPLPKPANKAAIESDAGPPAGGEPRPAAKPAAAKPMVASRTDSKTEEPAAATGSIGPAHAPAREVELPPERRTPPRAARNTAREHRAAAHAREQHRLRLALEKAEREAARRRVVREAARHRAPERPMIRYYRAGSRDPSFSDIFR